MTRRAILAYVLTGLAVFVAVVLVRLPANLVTGAVQDAVPRDTLTLTEPQGSLWRGNARVSILRTDFGRLNWRISPFSIAVFAPRASWQFDDSGLSGSLEVDDEQAGASISGFVDLAQLAPILSRYDISAEGRLRFKDVTLEQTGQALSFAGQLDWTGGRVEIGAGSWRGDTLLPALRAVAENNSRLLVTLWDEQADEHLPAGEVELLEDGWVKLGVTGHLAKHFGGSFENVDNPAEIVLAVEEQLF